MAIRLENEKVEISVKNCDVSNTSFNMCGRENCNLNVVI